MVIIVCLVSGLLAVYVGLDYLPRLGPLGGWGAGRTVLWTLRGDGRPSDLLQDYAGARALLAGGNAYEPFGPLSVRYVPPELGYLLAPADPEVSTHPPTAFVLFLPLAAFSYPVAAALWTALMLAGLVVLVRASGATWPVAAFVGPVLVLLPPVALAVEQLTAAWLILLGLAIHLRHRPFVAGMLIGLAALTKYLPARALGALLVRRQWSAALGFCLVWTAALALVAGLNVDVLLTYLSGARANAAVEVVRRDNGAFLFFPLNAGGLVALLPPLALLGWIVWLEVRAAVRGYPDDLASWARWTWLPVALLPLAWWFSVLPLAIPAALAARRDRLAGLLAAAGLVPTLAAPTETPANALAAFGSIAATGAALALAARREGSSLAHGLQAAGPRQSVAAAPTKAATLVKAVTLVAAAAPPIAEPHA